jgi:hypothetical protein
MAVSISISIAQNSQSIANNTSNVTVSVIAQWTYGSWNHEIPSPPGWLKIDGTTYEFTSRFNLNNTTTGKQTLFTKTVDVAHNDDGSKTLACSASFDPRVTSTGTVTASASKVLTTIARASQPSCITFPEHTQNVGEFGDTISIHMNRKAAGFKHTVRYAFGSRTGTCINAETGKATNKDVETGFKWKIPEELMDLIPASTSGSGTIYVDTYNGTTLIGTKYCGFTATVPASVKPSCSFKLEDITGVDEIYGSPVKGLSKIEVNVTATLARSSPITAYSITVDGVRYSGSTAVTEALRTAGTSRVTATVTDNRGRSGSASYDMNVQNYSAPAITTLTVQRCNSDGTANRRGDHVKVTFSAAVSSMSGKNTAAYSLNYKKTTESDYTTVPFPGLNNNFAPANQTYIFPAAPGNSFDVVIQAVDRHNASDPATKSAKAPTAAAIFSWRGFKGSSKTEDGAGIGKVPEKANTLQVGWETEFEKDVRMVGAHAFYGAQGILDTRDTNETPEWYMQNHGMGVVWELKTLTVVGFTNPAATFGALQTIIPWKDSSGGLPRQVVYENGIRWTRIASTATSWGAWVSDLLRAYPVGSIYIAYHHTSPASLFGGTWERITNAFLWAVDGSGTIGQTGGAKEVTLTVNQLPAHSHGSVYSQHAEGTKDKAWYSAAGSSVAYGAVETGGGQAHNNMPPYIQVSVWRRTA